MKKTSLALIAGASLFVAAELTAQTVPAPQPTICNRACWTARASTCTTSLGSLTRAIIHHTGNANDYLVTTINDSKSKMRGTQNYHMDTQGWCDIGYHFVVDKLGNIFEARVGSLGASSGWKRGAHDGVNSNSMGFSSFGYYHPPTSNPVTTALLNSMYDVIAWRMPSGWSPYGSGSYGGYTAGTLDGHRRVSTSTCPGDGWWTYITDDFNGGTVRNAIATRRGASSAVIVDGATGGSASWITATSATDKYGSDYRYRGTESVSDAVTFTGNLPSTKTYSVSAWWSQGTNRSASAPYLIDHSGGTATVNANQQANGGKWNVLGSYSFASGNRTVRLSCWTTTGFVVIADAVKFE